ncbi:MAG: carboxypeptidase-like regulatory domain-containing protein, partial [Acidobacteriota bacterium]
AADHNGLELHLTSGEELHGTLEGAAAPRTINLEALSSMQNALTGGGASATVAADGSFLIPNVFPDRYRVTITPLPDGSYVKSLRVDAAESRDGTVDLTRGAAGARLKVTVSTGAASLEGAILNADGKPAEIPLVFVLLAATSDDLRQENLRPLNAGGRYNLKNIRPGKYRLFAVEPRQITGIDSLKPLFERAEQIEIKEGDKITRDLKLPGNPPKEATGAR